MIAGLSPVTQALLGTLFTWGLTAAGSGVVFFLAGTKVSGCVRFYRCSLCLKGNYLGYLTYQGDNLRAVKKKNARHCSNNSKQNKIPIEI